MVSSVGCNFFAFISEAGCEETDEGKGDFVPIGKWKPLFELGRWENVELVVNYKC